MVDTEPGGLQGLCYLLKHIKWCSLDRDGGGRAVGWVETVYFIEKWSFIYHIIRIVLVSKVK